MPTTRDLLQSAMLAQRAACPTRTHVEALSGPAFEMGPVRSRPARSSYTPSEDEVAGQAAARRYSAQEETSQPAERLDQPAGADTPGGQLTGPAATWAYLTGGRATFTLVGRDSRYTFKVSRKEPAEGETRYTQPVYFVALLTGPDNTADYTYLGVLDVARGLVRLTAKSRYTDTSTPVVALRWAVARLQAGQALPAPAAIYHLGRCGRCGRALTVPSSIESGFGPECSAKLGGG